MAELFWVGRGSSSWRDRRNWSRRSGGTPGAQAPTGVETVVLDGNSGFGDVDLTGCPYRSLTVRSGFRGRLRGLMDGVTFGHPRAESAEDDGDGEQARVADFRPDVPERCPFCGQSETTVTGERSAVVAGPFSPATAAWFEERYGILGDDPVELVWAEWVGDGVSCLHDGPEIVESVDLVGPYQAVE